MSTKKVQAISGVSPNQDTTMMTVYPSICAGFLGRLIGSAMEFLPVRIMGLKPSNLLIGPIAAPFALLAYVLTKITGTRYRLSNKVVQIWSAIGVRQLGEAALTDVDSIDVEEQSGQQFYHSANLVLRKGNGDVLLRLPGVVRPEIFRRIILKARDAQMLVAESMKTIEARQST
jgi:hypothetical protein